MGWFEESRKEFLKNHSFDLEKILAPPEPSEAVNLEIVGDNDESAELIAELDRE